MLMVILVVAIASGLYQLWLFAGALALLANGYRSVTVGIIPGIVSVILFALYFLL